MPSGILIVVCSVLLLPMVARPQPADAVTGSWMSDPETDGAGELKSTRVQRTPEQMEASFTEHKGDFDYLLGDWEFTADSKEWGTHGGYWSAVKLAEGQILDEYRVTGDKGETYYVTTSLRNYNKFADRWELIGADAGTGMQDFGTARRVGSEIHIEQKFGVTSGEAAIMRIRYYNIEKDRFSWVADRSTDGGKTWVKNHLQIEARRIGPPRSLGPLAPARNKASAPRPRRDVQE